MLREALCFVWRGELEVGYEVLTGCKMLSLPFTVFEGEHRRIGGVAISGGEESRRAIPFEFAAVYEDDRFVSKDAKLTRSGVCADGLARLWWWNSGLGLTIELCDRRKRAP